MYLLDTVAISDTSKDDMHPGMQRFISTYGTDLLHISVVSIGELRYGWVALPNGKRRDALREWVESTEEAFNGRVLDIDADVARSWGDLRVTVVKSGYSVSLPDLLIAATAIHHDLTVVTRNVRDFEPTGCRILNPWDSAPGTD